MTLNKNLPISIEIDSSILKIMEMEKLYSTQFIFKILAFK